MSRRVHVALFTSEESLLAALRACRENGLTILDVRSPYPVHGIDELIGIRRTRLPAACLTGGVLGLGLALWFEAWTSAIDWPLDVGGKPWNSLPAFAPVAFEMTVLFAGLATVFGLLLRSGLLPGRSADVLGRTATRELRVTNDRFAVFVARPDAALTDRAMGRLWEETGAVETHAIVEEARR